MTTTETQLTSNAAAVQRPRRPPGWSVMRFGQQNLPFRHERGRIEVQMPGPYWVHQKSYREAFNGFWRNARNLQPLRVYLAPQLFDPVEWQQRVPGEQRAIGRCIKHFALRGVLPITLVNPEVRSNFKYLLNEDLDQPPTIH